MWRNIPKMARWVKCTREKEKVQRSWRKKKKERSVREREAKKDWTGENTEWKLERKNSSAPFESKAGRCFSEWQGEKISWLVNESTA